VSVARTTQILDLSQTNNKKGLRTSNYSTDYIYQGKCHSCTKRLTVETGTNLIIVFDMSAAVAAGKAVSLYTPVMDATTGPVLVDYYYGSDYTGGTDFPCINRAYYGGTTLSTIKAGGTGTDKGTKFSEGAVFAGHKSSSASQEGLEFVPVQTNILAEIDNTNGADSIVLINFVWFEV